MAGPPTNTTLMVNGNGPPDLPPRVDRNTKPLHGNRANIQRSATDRLFSQNGMDDIPNYINATPHHQRTHTSTSKQVCNNQILDIYLVIGSIDCNFLIIYFFSCMICTIAMTACHHMIATVCAMVVQICHQLWVRIRKMI